MTEVLTIQFTQEQARTLTGVSAETIRHWRKVVPYLAAKPGKSARFTFADVVGLAVTRELIVSFGVHIASVGPGINRIFQILSETRPTLLEDAIAVVTAQGASLSATDEFTNERLSGPALVVPLNPLIARLRHHMMPVAHGSEQATLPFAPRMVRGGS